MESVKNLPLECPICQAIPRKAVYQCPNGHVICDRCITKLENCPTCHVVLIQDGDRSRNRFFTEECLDNLMYYCPYADRGCRKKFPKNGLTNHTFSCKYGVALHLCKFLGYHDCNFKLIVGNADAAAEHLKTKHSCRKFMEAPNTNASLTFLFTNFKKIMSLENVQSATWYFLWNRDLGSPGEKNFVVACKVENECASWICLDLEIGSSLFSSASIADKVDIALTVPTTVTGGTKLKWNLPVVSGLDAANFLENPPFHTTIQYLSRLWKDKNGEDGEEGDLCMNIIVGKGSQQKVFFQLNPNVDYKGAKCAKNARMQ